MQATSAGRISIFYMQWSVTLCVSDSGGTKATLGGIFAKWEIPTKAIKNNQFNQLIWGNILRRCCLIDLSFVNVNGCNKYAMSLI